MITRYGLKYYRSGDQTRISSSDKLFITRDVASTVAYGWLGMIPKREKAYVEIYEVEFTDPVWAELPSDVIGDTSMDPT